MTFEGQYLTYNEYLQLGGTAIGEMPFNLLEFEARKQIDLRTFNRLKNQQTILQDVKLCEYNLINKIKGYLDTVNCSNGNVSSENTDGYSVSYITPENIANIIKSENKALDDTIRTYLLNIIVNNEHIMYVGVR